MSRYSVIGLSIVIGPLVEMLSLSICNLAPLSTPVGGTDASAMVYLGSASVFLRRVGVAVVVCGAYPHEHMLESACDTRLRYALSLVILALSRSSRQHAPLARLDSC